MEDVAVLDNLDEDIEDLGYLIDELDEIYPERDYILRSRIDHLTYWNDEEFFQRFRLSKQAVQFVLELIEDHLQHRTIR